MATSETLKSALNRANPNTLADVLAKIDLGTMLAPNTVTVAQSAATTITLDPPALFVAGVRVTGGAAAAGVRTVTDAGGSASATVCTLSADGATLTFEANVTGAVVTYMARPAVDLDTAWPSI